MLCGHVAARGIWRKNDHLLIVRKTHPYIGLQIQFRVNPRYTPSEAGMVDEVNNIVNLDREGYRVWSTFS
jgi:hypothetical protein